MPAATSFLLSSIIFMASVWASFSFSRGPEMVRDLSKFALPLTLAPHFVLSQISCLSFAVRVPGFGIGMGPIFPSIDILAWGGGGGGLASLGPEHCKPGKPWQGLA